MLLLELTSLWEFVSETLENAASTVCNLFIQQKQFDRASCVLAQTQCAEYCVRSMYVGVYPSSS